MSFRKRQIQFYKSVISLGLILAMLLVILLMGRGSEQDTGNVAVENVASDTAPVEDVPQAEALPREGSALPEDNIFQEAVQKIQNQTQVDEMLRAELESGAYSFEEPLTVLDPYGASPLTALVLFSTDRPSRIEVVVPGEDEDTEAVHRFSEVSAEHSIPVYGLYPGANNKVTLRQLAEDGRVLAEKEIEIQTEPLPDWLNGLIILTEHYQGDYEAGLNYKIRNGKYAFDKNGEIRWFFLDNHLLQPTYLKYLNNRFIVACGSYHAGDVLFYEVDKLGKIYSVYYAPYGAHHDISATPSGNLLITGSQGNTVEDFVYEIDRSTGNIENTLDFKQILQRTRVLKGYFNGLDDWMHNNSIVYDESDGSMILSSNMQSTVLKISWPEGEIKWLLSTPEGYMPKWQPYLLEPVGENFEYSYNQHDVTVLPDYDNDPDTIDILLFDNGTSRFAADLELQRQIAANEIVAPEKYSRMVHYRIHEKDMTVEQIWQYGKERGLELYSGARGSAALLPNGNRTALFDNETSAISTKLVEVGSDSKLVWDAEIFSDSGSGDYIGYKMFRLPFYFDDEKEQDIYTEARNMIPQEMLDEYT